MWSILTSPEDTVRVSGALFFSANKEEKVEVLSIWTIISTYVLIQYHFFVTLSREIILEL